MSNKNQISWKQIKSDWVQLGEAKIEENYLFINKNDHQNFASQMVTLKKLQRRIRFIKERIIKFNEWRLESINKLIIC